MTDTQHKSGSVDLHLITVNICAEETVYLLYTHADVLHFYFHVWETNVCLLKQTTPENKLLASCCNFGHNGIHHADEQLTCARK